jgi:hypothetical protein
MPFAITAVEYLSRIVRMGDIVCPKIVRIARKREGGSENGERRDGGNVELTLAFEVGRQRAAPLVGGDNERTRLGTAIVRTRIGLKWMSKETARGEVGICQKARGNPARTQHVRDCPSESCEQTPWDQLATSGHALLCWASRLNLPNTTKRK